MACFTRRFALAALVSLFIALPYGAAHPALTGKPLGTHYPEASSFVYGTEMDKYDRYDTTIMQGIGKHGGDPTVTRTVKLHMYTPPVVIPKAHHIPGWTTKTFPCVSEGALQCDGWHIIEMKANSWQDAVNNTDAYYWDVGMNFKNDCECTHPTACELIPGENGAEDRYRMWFPLVQFLSNSSTFPYDEGDIEPTQAVFWTYDADVQKYGVLKGGKPILDFSEQPLFIRNDTGLQGYANGKRAMQGFVADWNRCDFMTFGDKRVAPILDSVFSDLENDQMFDDGAEALKTDKDGNKVADNSGKALDESVIYTEQDNGLIVAALGISGLSLVVAVGALAYACMMARSSKHEVSNQVSQGKKPVAEATEKVIEWTPNCVHVQP